MQDHLEDFEDMELTAVAVIGISCRFPGAENHEAYWQMLAEGRCGITYFSDEALIAAGIPAELTQNPQYVKAKPILPDYDAFDAHFFGYNPREAEIIAPQYRLFMEAAWAALEDGGYHGETFPGLIGLYAGTNANTYLTHNLAPNEGKLGRETATIVPGTEGDFLTLATSFKLNLRGPSVNVQSFCSTSAVAVHMACQSLLYEECDMALAGASNVYVPHISGYLFHEGGIGSRHGVVRAFDAAADGTIFGSGVGLVLLRRLSDALEARDHIYAVIRGSAVNNDGALKVSFSAPSVDGQAAAIVEAMSNAEVTADQIGYVETHGTGTNMGDPVEISGLTKAFRQTTDAVQFCAVGSVKPNVGHLDRASGIAGLIKAVLALKNRQIPPSLNFETPNPKIDFPSTPFYVNTRLTDLPETEEPFKMGVSSFGVGGTNAHFILEEAPPREPGGPARPWQVLPVSARTEEALNRACAQLAAFLNRHPDTDLADAAYSLQVGRKAFNHRRIIVASSCAEAARALESGDPRRAASGYTDRGRRPVAFMFSGQGSQYGGMGCEVYRDEAVYREAVDRCMGVVRALDPELAAQLSAGLAVGADQHALDQTLLTQPALFVTEYALARLWDSWGVTADVLIGHSIGEYVAATLAGVFSLEDALKLVVGRARLMNALPAGGMTAVAAGEAELASVLGDDLSLAVVNGPNRCVVAGTFDALERAEAAFKAKDLFFRRLSTSHAFHSHMTEPALASFRALFDGVPMQAPKTRIVSNVTGTWMTAEQACSPDYWVSHLRQTVRFGDGVALVAEDADTVLLEVGPGKVLADLARGAAKDRDAVVLAGMMKPKADHDEGAGLAMTVGRLWLAGLPLDWRKLHPHPRNRIPLPTYAFERSRYWIDVPAAVPGAGAAASGHRPMDKMDNPADWFYMPGMRETAPTAVPKAVTGSWLVFCDAQGLAAKVADTLAQMGASVTRVLPGDAYAAEADGYRVAPGNPEHYRHMVAALVEADALPTHVVHGWCVWGRDGAFSLAEGKDRAFYSLFFFAQALAAAEVSMERRLTLLADSLWNVTGEERVEPVKGTLLGALRVLPLEAPGLQCRAVDVGLPQTPEAVEATAARVVAEAAGDMTDECVALRGGKRWVEHFVPMHSAPAETERLPLVEEGVYLITGGLGGIGLVLARYLAETYRARLILTGRGGLPARETWASIMAGPETAESRRIARVQELEALGASVWVVAADVADAEAMDAGLRPLLAQLGRLDGIVHAAGTAGGGLAQFKTRDMAEQVLAPKIDGTLILHSLAQPYHPAFFMLCSSVTSVTGGIGRLDYTAANGFMDAFAQNGAGRVVSVNWDAWAEVGMAVATEAAARKPRVVDSPALTQGEAFPGYLCQKRYQASETRTVFAGIIDADTNWLLQDHLIFGNHVLPGASYLDMLSTALADTLPALRIHDLLFLTPMVVGKGKQREINLEVDRTAQGFSFSIVSRPYPEGGAWVEHCAGKLASDPNRGDAGSLDPAAVIDRGTLFYLRDGVQDINEADSPLTFGEHWKVVRACYVGEGEAIAHLVLPEQFRHELATMRMHPSVLDFATSFSSAQLAEDIYLPVAYQDVAVYGPLPEEIYSYCTYDASSPLVGKSTIKLDFQLTDKQGRVLVHIRGFSMKKLSTGTLTLPKPEEAGSARHEDDTERAVMDAALRPAEGLDAFLRILAGPAVPQVVVCTKHFPTFKQAVQSMKPMAAIEDAEETGTARTAYPRPSLPNPFVAPEGPQETLLAAIWADLLGLECVGRHDNFFDLGGDSILALQIISRARKEGMGLTPADLFDNPTVAETAALVDGDAPAPAVEDVYVPEPVTVSDEPDFSLSGLDEADRDKLFDLLG